MHNINPLTCIDFYKGDHRRQYPKGTELVFSNLTPRSNKNADKSFVDREHIVFFGLQYFIKDFLIRIWNEGFFNLKEQDVVDAYKRRMDTSLGVDAIPMDHIIALHRLGYLPIEIMAVEEGRKVPMGVPCLTMHNTQPEFFWLTNYLETVLSTYLWLGCTSATTAYNYRLILEKYADETGVDKGFVDFQGHDFSFRGMSSLQSAALSGAGHLLSFKGTDTVLAIDFLEQYYMANADKSLIGCSVPATEHSVMCMGGETDEIGTFKRLITELYPKGIVSIVSDTWDFWQVVSEYTRWLHTDIMARDGKVVFRPDSGDPVKIIVGDPDAEEGTPQCKGAVEVLFEIFGGKVNKHGYKELDPHVGLIYGDSITPTRATAILEGLKQKKFASSNIVFGIGSFTYQYATRDTWGFAVKATFGMVDGLPREIFKNPKTDDGLKKSAKGLLRVVRDSEHKLTLQQGVSWEDVMSHDNELETVFLNGVIIRKQFLEDIRDILKYHRK